MSERIVNDPSLHGWVETDDGKWVWDAASGGSGGSGGGLWEQNGDDIYYDEGNVGIGAPAGNEKLRVEESGQATLRVATTSADGAANLYLNAGTKNWGIRNEADTKNFVIRDLTAAQDRLTIDATGNAAFSATVNAQKIQSQFFLKSDGSEGFFIGNGVIYPGNSAGAVNDSISLGDSSYRFKNAYFSGTVDAAGFTVNGVPISGGGGGLPDGGYTYNYQFAAPTSIIAFVNGNLSNGIKAEASAGSSYRNTLAHTDYGLEFQSNSSTRAWKFANAGGDRVVISTGGNVTATDFIATSDERAKDNITTAPVGLIDSLKGREWEWKESGEKGSGVVAQELEQVLPHLVHEDEDGMKSVSYMGLCAYLIEELKDCRERLAVLEAKE